MNGKQLPRQEETMSNSKEYNAKYYAEHKEELSKKRKEMYKKDRERIIERNKKWLKDNREQWNEYMREYRRRRKENAQRDTRLEETQGAPKA